MSCKAIQKHLAGTDAASSYFALCPAVDCELGRHTELDFGTRPPGVRRLHVVFSDWLGAELLAVHPCFLVTEKLGERLLQEQLTGFELSEVEVDLSPEGAELLEGQALPAFRWLKVTAQACAADFGLMPRRERLVVSGRALSVLQKVSLGWCGIERYDS